MPLSKDLSEFIELLNANGVEFLVVGGFAVAWHGHPRFTADIDFLIRPDPVNAERVMKTLREFGFGGLQILPAELCQPDQIVQLGVKPNRIDLITSVAGLLERRGIAESPERSIPFGCCSSGATP